MSAAFQLRRVFRHLTVRRPKDPYRRTFAHIAFASFLIVTLLYGRVTTFSTSEELQIAIRAAAHPPSPHTHIGLRTSVEPHATAPTNLSASPDAPLRSRVDAIVGEGHSAKEGLVDIYALPSHVVDHMTHPVATRLYWKLVYTDVVYALRAQQEEDSRGARFEAAARVLFIHAQNGLGNRLRTVASGLAMARGTRRVPVVVWERDAHLGASFTDLFVTKAHGSDIATILYRDLIVMESFPDWKTIADRQLHWYPVSFMEKDSGPSSPNTVMRFAMPAVPLSLSEPRSLMNSVGSVEDVSKADLYLTRPSGGGGRSSSSSDRIDPSMHVYFKSAYVARADPFHLSSNRFVNKELSGLLPTDEVTRMARTVDWDKLKKSIGIHIRSRRLDNDNVDVVSSCEYTHAGAHTTDYWRQQSRLPVFVYKMEAVLKQDPQASFFVAADDVETIENLEKKFPGRVESVQRSCDDRNPDCVKFAMADLLCLSQTRRIYGSNWSSFSEAAGRLGNKRIFLSGRHFGVESRRERRRRVRRQRFWRTIDRIPFVGLLNGCWWRELVGF